jgi:tetratricopeptide (TPR) repeat protein
MTQPCMERDGLPHAVFLRRLAGARSATSPDARLGNGAFLALRLVDLLGPGRGSAHADVFRYQHAATERVCRELPGDRTETSHLTGLVRAVAHAFQDQDARIAVPALFAYAHYLEDELRLEEALDVLDSLLGIVDERLAPSDEIAAQLRIGRVNRKLNRLDEADARYSLAAQLARAAGDVHSAFLSRVGRALAVQTRGNLAAAEQSFRDIATEARAAGEQEIEAHAEHALGTTLLFRGQIAEAIGHVWRGFELYEDDASQLRTLNDLGVMLLALGRANDAERALAEVVRRGAQPERVTNAMIELMHCSSYRRDRLGFERRRTECESRTQSMPPNILTDFHLKAGIGSARFGRFQKAQAYLGTALNIAVKNGLNEFVFRIERIMAGLRDCAPYLETKHLSAAEPAISTDVLQEVSAGLKRLDRVPSGTR